MKAALSLVIVILAAGPNALAQTAADSVRDIAALRADVAQVKGDLDSLKLQLALVLRALSQRQAPAARPAPVSTSPVRARIAGAPALGRADAPVTIVEFSDYQCPFCQRFYATTLPILKEDYIAAGKVRYVFRDYPLANLHPNAHKAAEAAYCAGEQGRFWEMHDVLFQNQHALEPPQLTEHARTIGLDAATFRRCLTSGRHASQVDRGIADGAAAGVQGTPGFIIGRTREGDIVEGTALRGALPLETFRQIIDQLLAPPKTQLEITRATRDSTRR
jgi:protein-disulfide isomerase